MQVLTDRLLAIKETSHAMRACEWANSKTRTDVTQQQLQETKKIAAELEQENKMLLIARKVSSCTHTRAPSVTPGCTPLTSACSNFCSLFLSQHRMKEFLTAEAQVFEQQLKALKQKGSARRATLAAQCDAAYIRTVKPFHGWASRRGAAVAFGLTPEWADVCGRSGLSASDEALKKELSALVGATRELCERLKSMQVKLGLEDTRRSI